MRRVVLLAVVTGFFVGCGSNRVPVYPVSGRLTVNGKPPPEGWVAALHLEPAPTGEYPHPLPRARVGEDGRFQFHTYGTDDGAPAGTYKISFIDMTEKVGRGGKEDPEDDKEDKRAKNSKGNKKVRQVYWPNPIEIRPELNELPSFDLNIK
jgi:hypothetical protein